MSSLEYSAFETKQLNHNNIHRCEVCSWSTKSIFPITNHCLHEKFDCSKSISTYNCKDCSYKTFFATNIKSHRKKVHQLDCKATTYDHISTNRKCRQCHFQTFSMLCSLRHNDQDGCQQGTDKIYECNECDYTAKHIAKLKLHFHMNTKRFECDQCQQKFKRKHSVQRHIKTQHTADIRWLHCDQCEYKTKLKYRLMEHIRNKHTADSNIKWFTCKHCEYKGKSRFSLNRHMKAHTMEGDLQWFRCDHCEYKSTENCRLKKHIQHKHANGNSYIKCEQCIYKTKSSSYFNRHMKVHSAREQWFKCDRCEYKAKCKPTLKQHVLYKHTADGDIKWFKCEHCQYKSKLKGDMRKHVKTRHTANETERNSVYV